ncbi:apolipophorins [Anthonomus grandis grandis]|uniref:apolipophorins n=1 Tax=Anthonomus grandis grandis TaxID=2921223 RepID=UPI00216623D5|nr:apolipophorins [Anthonomus grandis grandis]
MDGSSGHRWRTTPLGLLVFLVILVIGFADSEDVCRSGCKQASPHTFKYSLGTTYKYSYEGKIDIALSSAEGQTTSTLVKADVLLTQLPDCNQLIRLQNVIIAGANGKKHGSIPDIEKPIRINNNDGLVDDSICVVDGDNQNSINVKRAIASIFQAVSKSGFETDVFGRCPTDVATHKEGDVVVIQKARSLNKCFFREHIQHDFLTTALNLNSEIKSSPILNGDYSATLKIKNGILDQATVSEDYLFVPFSVGKNGAKAQVISKLHFSGSSPESPQVTTTKPRSIIFENPHPVVAPGSNVQTIQNAVKEVAKTIDIVVGENTAREFINLLKIVRVSNKNDLLAVYNQVKSGVGVGDKEAAKRLYLDALLRAGNGDTVEALLELLDKKQLDETDRRLVLLGLNVVRHATAGSVKAATTLLNTANLPREAYLGIGNLAGKFCQQHDCSDNAEIKTLTSKLLAKIGTKPTNREQENDAVFALKALANFHHLNENVIPKLTGLAQNKNIPNRVRVAALETYLADPCKDKLRNSALQILQDIQQDSEVRIKAYLAVAQCPNAKIGNAIKALLLKEPSIQVGGFIASHIHALRASANPDKSLAKQFLGFSVRRNFPIDPRKYSFNGEFSYSIDTLGYGAAAESNVIYSQNSWLPRSSNLNLTAEIFGHRFNTLEIEIRQENLDRLVEHYFGPKGVLRHSMLSSTLKEGKNKFGNLAQYVEQKLKATLNRNRRDVSKAEIDHIAKQVQIKTSELNKDLDLDLGVKAFGGEIFFLNINQEAKVKPEEIIDKIIQELNNGLDKLNNFDETLRRNINFLDTELAYPTSLGFPLRLAVEGTATIQIKAQGSIDLRHLLNNPDKGELKIKLAPSSNIEVSGKLTLDSLVVENGLKVISTLYSSTGGDLTASWDQSSGFDVKFGLPVAEQKLMSANHEIVFVNKEQAGREKNLPLKFTQVKDFSICLDQLSPFIGLTFCAEVNGPNLEGQQIPILPFPLAGDAKIAVTIENDDVSEYHIRHNTKEGHADLIFETIGKDGQKKVSLDLAAEYSPEKFIRALFSSPQKQASAEARIVMTNVERSLLLKLTNDQEEFSGKIGVAVSGTSDKTIYKPILEYRTPQGLIPLPVKTEGQVIVEQNGENFKLTFENIKVVSEQYELGLQGTAGKDSGIWFTDISMAPSPGANVKFEGRLQLTVELVKFNVKMENTINSNANFNLKGELKRQVNNCDVAIQLIHGPDLNSKTAILTITSSIVNKFKSSSDFRFATKQSIKYPLIGVNAKLELEQTPNSIDYDINLEYGELKLGSELEAKVNEKSNGDYQVEFEVWGLENKLEVKSSRQVLPNDQSKISNTIELNGRKLKFDGVITHAIRPHYMNVGTDLTIHVPTQAGPIKVSTGLKMTEEDVDAHAKINSGSDSIIDSFLRADKKGNANGSLKLAIRNLINLNGQVHSNSGTGNGEVVVDLQNGKRQFKADTTFNVQPDKRYDISINFYPNAKDNSAKISISTQTNMDENSLETKNKVDAFGYPLEVNAKASKTGNNDLENLNSELEITLPGEQYLQAKSNFECKGVNDLYTGHVLSSVEYRKNKNTPGTKYSYKGSWRNSNMEEGIIDADINISADDSNGKNINNDLTIKSTKQGELQQLNLHNKVSGSILSNPLEVRFVSNCNKGVIGDYDLQSSYGNANNLQIKGNHDLSKPKKEGALKIQLTSASEPLKSLNVDLKGSVTKTEDPSAPVQVEGSVSVDAANAEGSFVTLKSSGDVVVGPLSGKVKGSMTLNKLEPISIDASYNLKEDQRGGSANSLVTYGNGQSVKSEVSLDRTSDHQYKLVAGLDTVTAAGPKSHKIIVNTKRSQGGNEVVSSVELVVDGKTWKVNSELGLSEISPVVNVKLVCPEGKLRQIYLKGHKVSDRQFGGELKLVNEEKSFLLDGSININVENIENLIIKGHVNSPSLKLNKIVFEASNKAGSSDRKLNVNIKVADKNYLSGELSYAAKEENGKFIIDGSGDFKMKDQSRSGNFKYILEKLETAKNGEQGVQVSFDASLGDRAIDSEYKLTNKHFRLQNSYCEKTKECAYIEIENKINANDASNFNQVLEISLDLRKLGLSHEFGLKATTNRKEWVIDHTVDAHFQNNANSKYQYSFYIHPTEAGVSLTTPKRLVALEAHSVPFKNLREGGKASGELAFYIDKKNHPNKKTALSWSLDVNTSGKINGQMKFNHPGLNKPLSSTFTATRSGTPYNGQIDIQSVLDIFAQDDQKLVYTYHKSVKLDSTKTKGSSKITFELKSSGLGIDIRGSEIVAGDRVNSELTYNSDVKYRVGSTKWENSLASKWSPNEVSGHLKLLNQVLIDASNKIRVSENEQVIESKVSSYDNNPIVSRMEIKNYNTVAYSVGFEKQPDRKLLFNAGLIPDQIADIRADIQEGGNKQNLFFATVKLDDANFLKSDHKVDSKAIQNVLGKIKERSTKYFEGLEQLGEKWIEEAKKEAQDLNAIAQKATPNMQPLKQFYAKEFEELKQEILNDKSVKELSDAIQKVLGTLISVTTEWFEKLSQFAEETSRILEESFKTVIQSIEKELLPQIKTIVSNLMKEVNSIAQIILDMALNIVGKGAEILEKYQPELQELAGAFRELFKDVGKLIQNIYNNGLESVREIIQRISNELKASPAIEELKAQYEQFIKEGLPSADAVVNTIREVFETIKDIIPNEFVIKSDINMLLDSVTDYIEKKLKNQPVDDIAAFEQIGQVLANIVKKLSNIIRTDNIQLPGSSVDSSSFLPLSYFNNLPKLVAVKFSPISYILDQESNPEIGKFVLSLFTDPLELVAPFQLFGLIVQGQHIFTFDGKHITFPGKCNYLLVRDAINGNFTLAGTYKDGLLTAITLADSHGSITLQQGGKVKINQDATELPIRKQTLAAWRGYETISLHSTAGITVECVPDLQGCVVSVSGFYHGQLRGLLGNGNAEPYDDFTLPNGKIVTAEGQFGNGYKLSSSCPDVTPPKHESIPENPTCNKLFNYESSLRLCYPFVATENFKAACAHGLAANVKGTEEAIAKAYVAACQIRHVPIHVPEHLVKCTNSEKPFSVGDTFSVKLPSKSADIVVIVDSEKANQKLYDKLVKQLIPEITSELGAKAVRDVEFHLVTYGGLNQWPSHITVGGKLTFKGKPPALKFGEEPKPDYDIKDIENPQIQKWAGDIKEAIHEIGLASGLNLKSRTFDAASNYPFRANALKSIIVVNGDECEVGKLYPLQKLFAYLYKNNKITLNLFTPFSTLKLKDAKKTKDIIGFNSQNVFTLSQGKKNPKGTAELHKELNYEDYCVDFTVNQNRGNAFVNNNFLSLNDADQKQYIKIAASNIAEQLINVEQGLDCECKMVNPWSAVNVCSEAFSRDRPSKKV